MSEPRFYPAGHHGYLVAELDVPGDLRGEITRSFLVRNPIEGANGREPDRRVIQCPRAGWAGPWRATAGGRVTRLPDGVARPGQKRMATSAHGDLVVVLTDRTVTMKPKGSRVNGIVVLTWGAIYQRAIAAEVDAARRGRTRRAR